MVPQEQFESHSFAIENKEGTTPSSNVNTNIIGDLFFLWIGQKKASVLQHSVKFPDIDTTLLKSAASLAREKYCSLTAKQHKKNWAFQATCFFEPLERTNTKLCVIVHIFLVI